MQEFCGYVKRRASEWLRLFSEWEKGFTPAESRESCLLPVICPMDPPRSVDGQRPGRMKSDTHVRTHADAAAVLA